MTPEGVQKETGVRSGVHKIRGHEIRGFINPWSPEWFKT
jgi:hypothetical protein